MIKSPPSSSCPHDLKAQQAGVTARPPPGDVSRQSWGRSHGAHTGGHSLEQGTPRPSRPPQQGLSWNCWGGGRCALRSRGQHQSHERLRPCPPPTQPRGHRDEPGSGDMRGAAGSAHTWGGGQGGGEERAGADRSKLEADSKRAARNLGLLRPLPPLPRRSLQSLGLEPQPAPGDAEGRCRGGDAPQGRLGCMGGCQAQPGSAGPQKR